MIVVPIARDRCLFYRKFLLTLGPCLACRQSSVLALAASCGPYTQAALVPARWRNFSTLQTG